MSRIYFIITFFILITSCSKQTSFIGKNLINQEILNKDTKKLPEQPLIQELLPEETKEEVKEVLPVKAEKNKNILFILDEDRNASNQNIINSIYLTLKEFKSNINVKFVKGSHFSSHDLKEKNIDIVVGPLNDLDDDYFEIATENNIRYISLNKKPNKLSSKMFFRPTKDQKYKSLFEFLKKYNKTEIAFLLPSNNKANNIYEAMISTVGINDFNIANTEFYLENDKDSIRKAIKKIKNNLTHTVLVNSSNKQIKINYKTLTKEEKKNIKNKKLFEEKNLKHINKDTDTIFILANDLDYEFILSFLSKEEFFEKNIFFITETRNISLISNNDHFKNFFFLWSNPLLKEEFDAKYQEYFKEKANEISYLIYDLIASLINWMEFENKDPEFFTKNIAFHGIYGDFKFHNKTIFRRFGLYTIDDRINFYLYFKPENFFN